LRLRVVLLEDDIEELHEQLADDDNRMDELEQAKAALQDTNEDYQAEFKTLQMEIKTKGREIENLKVCSVHDNACSSSDERLGGAQLSQRSV
jgi:chromosome segregation ATPase